MGDFSAGMGSLWLFALLALVGVMLLVTPLVRVIGGGIRGNKAGIEVTSAGRAKKNRAYQILDEFHR